MKPKRFSFSNLINFVALKKLCCHFAMKFQQFAQAHTHVLVPRHSSCAIFISLASRRQQSINRNMLIHVHCARPQNLRLINFIFSFVWIIASPWQQQRVIPSSQLYTLSLPPHFWAWLKASNYQTLTRACIYT